MFRKFSALAIAATSLWLGFSMVHAEVVTLVSPDRAVSLTGELQAFDGQTYQLKTMLGTLEIDSSTVECEGTGCPDLVADLNEFTIAGSNTIGMQMLPDLIEAYALNLGGELQVEALAETKLKYTVLDANGDPYVMITVDQGKSNDAFSALENKEAFIGVSSRRATEAERNRFLHEGKGDLTDAAHERILALDGIVAIVSPENPIRNLSLDQISDIFAGNIRNWREVGGNDARINVYRRDQNSGATQVFESLVMSPFRKVMANTAIILDTNAAISDAVTQDPYGIGLTSFTDERGAKILSFESVCGQVFYPDEFSIKTEEYPISRRLYLYTSGRSIPDKAREFINFATSADAQSIIGRSGFINQNVMAMSLDSQGRRLAHALLSEQDRDSLALLQELVAELQDADRLSLTFRFKSGSIEPDNRAMADIARLADMVKRGDFNGKRLIIIGFAENTGAINENQRLSQARAESVRDVLLDAVGAEGGNVQFMPVGYGKLAPLGCNETEDGRATNRRVEVWVR